MSNSSEARNGPVFVEDHYLLATDEQVRESITSKIERAIRERAQSKRHALFYLPEKHPFILITGSETVRVERSRLKDIAFQVMDTYGFNEKHQEQVYHGPDRTQPEVDVEVLEYKSTEVSGLSFYSERNLYRGTSFLFLTRWSVGSRYSDIT